MKLANLVKNKNLIKEIDHDSFLKNYEEYVNSLVSILMTCDASKASFIEQLQIELSNLKTTCDHTNSILENINNHIQREINEIVKDWNKRGYIVADGFTGSDSFPADKEREVRSFITSDKTKQKILSIIQTFTIPKYACLEIGPGDGVWTPFLVAGDPLYLVDIQQEFLDSTAFKFPEQYRKRLRPYLLEFNDCFNLSKLPQNQIGFVFSWNVFEYFPATETRLYLESCYNVLRPGGRMLFSYNNCNFIECVNHAEMGNKSWMTEEILLSICSEIGFEIEKTDSSEESWMLIKKPGELKTVKTHQALGEIINQNS